MKSSLEGLMPYEEKPHSDYFLNFPSEIIHSKKTIVGPIS